VGREELQRRKCYVEGAREKREELGPLVVWAKEGAVTLTVEWGDQDIPCMDTTTFSWSETKTNFEYGNLVLMLFHQLSWEPIAT
jgi:hypothetical protein